MQLFVTDFNRQSVLIIFSENKNEMKNINVSLFIICLFLSSCMTDKKEKTSTETTALATKVMSSERTTNIHPISHATLVITYGDETIYVDPTGGKASFDSFDIPTIVLITDIHGDHMNIETLNALDLGSATVVAPNAVAEQLSKQLKPKRIVTLNNGMTKLINTIAIEAIPMYNLREEALKFHPKGRGNGYVLNMEDGRIYISGDTEDIPEMRHLQNIDKAFVCMNLPYTMTVDKAAEAVLEFQPKRVYPYHYRGKNGMSDIEKFKHLIDQGTSEIEVVQLNWYP